MNRAVDFGVVAVILAAAAVVAATTGYLPDPVATHFGRSGRANGWMSREGYAWLMSTLMLVVPLASWLALTVLPRRWPRLVNVPFRDYWLAPERREATLARLAMLGAIVALLAVAVLAVVHAEIVEANRRVPPTTDPMSEAVTLAIAAGILVVVVGVALSFRRPKDAPP